MSPDDEPAASPLRSTSMPTEPVVEPRPPTGSGIDTQMVDLFFDRVPFGLAVFGTDRRLVRCNRTWTGFYELYFGADPGYTAPGRSLHDMIPGNDEALDQLFEAVLAGNVLRQAAHRIAIPGITTYWDVVFAPLYEGDEIVGVLDIVTDATDRVLSTERLGARIAAFTDVAAAMTVDQALTVTLNDIREQVLRTTPATACSLVTWTAGRAASDLGFTMAADPAFGEGYDVAVLRVHLGDDRDQVELSTRPTTVIRDARTTLLGDPRFAPLEPYWTRPTPVWDDLVVVPLVAGALAFGELQVHLPQAARIAPDDHAYLRAMADQAALATQNSVLFAEQARVAGIAERQRLARELHDSVSQALFSMTLHGRAAERRLAELGPDAESARTELARLQELTRGALAEMRALIFELRPGALAEEGLVAALTKQAAAIAAREQVVVEVTGPDHRLPLDETAEEHLYRVTLEALHNAVKHANPRRITVTVSAETSVDDARVVLEVADDGIGFDPEVPRPGHLGMGTMHDRALALGGTFAVRSTPGRGTFVRVEVPLPG